MQRILAFFILSFVKTFSMIFYRAEVKWLHETPANPWKNIRLLVFLNHTSLYEPLFLQLLPYSYLWHLASHLSVPGADVTLNRPIVGKFWKMMMPNISSVTRKKDKSWQNYLNSIKANDTIAIAPEGRMKRPNGLDKYGKPMSVKGGIADIIDHLQEGKMILCFSGGLHHVQAPGQTLPRLFKTIHMNLSYLDIKEYKDLFPDNSRERKMNIVRDLEDRIRKDCPRVTSNILKNSVLE